MKKLHFSYLFFLLPFCSLGGSQSKDAPVETMNFSFSLPQKKDTDTPAWGRIEALNKQKELEAFIYKKAEAHGLWGALTGLLGTALIYAIRIIINLFFAKVLKKESFFQFLDDTFKEFILFMLLLFITPLIGFIIGYIRGKRKAYRILRQLGLPPAS